MRSFLLGNDKKTTFLFLRFSIMDWTEGLNKQSGTAAASSSLKDWVCREDEMMLHIGPLCSGSSCAPSNGNPCKTATVPS